MRWEGKYSFSCTSSRITQGLSTYTMLALHMSPNVLPFGSNFNIRRVTLALYIFPQMKPLSPASTLPVCHHLWHPLHGI